jgi:hypothetical protein
LALENFVVYYGILLRFCSTLMYFGNFWFHFRCFRKFTTTFPSLLKWFKISKFLTWLWQKLKKSMSQISTWQNNLWYSQVSPWIFRVSLKCTYLTNLALTLATRCCHSLGKFGTARDFCFQRLKNVLLRRRCCFKIS